MKIDFGQLLADEFGTNSSKKENNKYMKWLGIEKDGVWHYRWSTPVEEFIGMLE